MLPVCTKLRPPVDRNCVRQMANSSAPRRFGPGPCTDLAKQYHPRRHGSSSSARTLCAQARAKATMDGDTASARGPVTPASNAVPAPPNWRQQHEQELMHLQQQREQHLQQQQQQLPQSQQQDQQMHTQQHSPQQHEQHPVERHLAALVEEVLGPLRDDLEHNKGRLGLLAQELSDAWGAVRRLEARRGGSSRGGSSGSRAPTSPVPPRPQPELHQQEQQQATPSPTQAQSPPQEQGIKAANTSPVKVAGSADAVAGVGVGVSVQGMKHEAVGAPTAAAGNLAEPHASVQGVGSRSSPAGSGSISGKDNTSGAAGGVETGMGSVPSGEAVTSVTGGGVMTDGAPQVLPVGPAAGQAQGVQGLKEQAAASRSSSVEPAERARRDAARAKLETEEALTALCDSHEHEGAEQRVGQLLAAGASPNTTDEEGIPALHLAAARGNVGALVALLGAGADVNVRDESGRTALHVASERGHLGAVERLVAAGVDVGARDQDGWTALLLSSIDGCPHVVDRLLGAGADVRGEFESGWTALHLSSRWGHLAVVARLLEAGADVGARDEYGGRTALHEAAEWGHAEVVEVLLGAGADPHVRDTSGAAPLALVPKRGNRRVARLLQEAMAEGADKGEARP